jgi:hypothetical protein
MALCYLIHEMSISYVSIMYKICIGINKVQYFSAYVSMPAILSFDLSKARIFYIRIAAYKKKGLLIDDP